MECCEGVKLRHLTLQRVDTSEHAATGLGKDGGEYLRFAVVPDQAN